MDEWADEAPPRMPAAEFRELEKTLLRLDDEDLSEWDREFVDDMAKRVEKHGRSVQISARQWEQIERMKGQYL